MHDRYGFQRESDGGVGCREWAPGAHAVSLIGEFNDWNRHAHPFQPVGEGDWWIALPPGTLNEGDRVKLHIVSDDPPRDRISPWIREVRPADGGDWHGIVRFPTRSGSKCRPAIHSVAPRIYEVHVGIATEDGTVGGWRCFADTHLDRIRDLGYDTVQLMAVQEHPYYGSFGYHVSSFFAPSARFGSTDDLRYLVDQCHRRDLAVWMDMVHSHAVTNVREGINRFDGTGGQFFHDGPRGYHPVWDSRLFDYGSDRVIGFLLSNLRYWIEEFDFDGFRFDGVTSMLYRDHGIARTFGGYDDYFGDNVDEDAVRFLQSANAVVRMVKQGFTTSAEDVSGMPGIARPVDEGGLGFDYRLAMGLPDAWGALLRETTDEDWQPSALWRFLSNRRPDERHIAYLESHDQCIVGDQSFAFRLMGSSMYTGMHVGSHDPVVDRGIALHKLLRLLTFTAGGDAWLTFFGNEFGHPEWVDFPREGNGWSGHHARRRWSLARDPGLRYAGLERFEKALLSLQASHGFPGGPFPELGRADSSNGLLVFHRAGWTVAVNLNPSRSIEDAEIPVASAADHRMVLNSDDGVFGGFGRGGHDGIFPWAPTGSGPGIRVYLPTRTGLVLAPVAIGPACELPEAGS